VQLRVPSFAEGVARALDEAGLPPSALTLEITERTLLDDQAVHRRALAELRELGVELALDDFGTGYSALGYLTRVPLDVLKVDRIFIARVTEEPRGDALLAGILAMARGLGLRTVAEGIEHGGQLDALRALGCDLGQGYLLARPAPAADVAALLAAAPPDGPRPSVELPSV